MNGPWLVVVQRFTTNDNMPTHTFKDVYTIRVYQKDIANQIVNDLEEGLNCSAQVYYDPER